MTDSMTAPLLAPPSTADARTRTADDGATVPGWHRGASPAAEAAHTPPFALEQI
ncbi:hypothetical protein XMIN_639 [Xanthomonas citri pv. mangiferaeindicae LMG 941]|nr:hypothetical protein XMIN_639 [Xanthomonas citri pv. mangiferaeindicae LMG 941]